MENPWRDHETQLNLDKSDLNILVEFNVLPVKLQSTGIDVCVISSWFKPCEIQVHNPCEQCSQGRSVASSKEVALGWLTAPRRTAVAFLGPAGAVGLGV